LVWACFVRWRCASILILFILSLSYYEITFIFYLLAFVYIHFWYNIVLNYWLAWVIDILSNLVQIIILRYWMMWILKSFLSL
jgi:hypothetical protein